MNNDTCACAEGAHEKNLRPKIILLAVGMFIYTAAILAGRFIPDLHPLTLLGGFLVAYFIIGGDIVRAAIKNIFRGKVFDENFLMTIATLGAFLIGEYAEAVAVMLFFQVGELFQSYAVGKSRRSIRALLDIRPDCAHVRRGDDYIQVAPEAVAIGETIRINPGERIPLDGRVISGHGFIDTAALTGESVPRKVTPAMNVFSGCINLSSVLEVVVEKEYGQGTVAKILELVEHAAGRKATAEHFITKFARVYTPIVVGAALLIALLPPLIGGADLQTWAYRALTFLVISCPCALVISIPLGFFGGLGAASRAGILVKGSNYLEALRQIEIVAFDKTGTLTQGNFVVSGIYPALQRQDLSPCPTSPAPTAAEILSLAALAESHSPHPIAAALMAAHAAAGHPAPDKTRLSDVQETAGLGVVAQIDGRRVCVGNAQLMAQEGVDQTGQSSNAARAVMIDRISQSAPAGIKLSSVPSPAATSVHVAYGGVYLGHILIADEIKPGARQTITDLKAAGIRAVMLSGDRAAVAADVAGLLGMDEYHGDLLPADKVAKIEELLTSRQDGAKGGGKLAFVGDGLNDAPVLALADIGIAMGGLGSDAAIEAADIVIMNDEPTKIVEAIALSQRTVRIVRQNIVLSLGVKIAVLILAALGFASMWAAVFADVGVALLAVMNAMRVLLAKQDCQQ